MKGKSAIASFRAGTASAQAFGKLRGNPETERLWMELAESRKLIIGFGSASYVALYRHEPDHDAAHVLAFRHQKEAGF